MAQKKGEIEDNVFIKILPSEIESDQKITLGYLDFGQNNVVFENLVIKILKISQKEDYLLVEA